MKKIIIAVVVLLLIGLGLAVQVYQENQRLENDFFLETTVSTRRMKAFDNELNSSLLRSRYGLTNDYEAIEQLQDDLDEEFDRLRYTGSIVQLDFDNPLQKLLSEYDSEARNKRT